MTTDQHELKPAELSDQIIGVLFDGLLLNFGQPPEFRELRFCNPRKKIRENPCKSVAKGSSSQW